MSDTSQPAEQDSPAKAEAAPENGSGGSGDGSAAVVRYGLMHHVGEFSHDLTPPPAHGTKVVVRTERGVELGEVVASIDARDDARGLPRKTLEAYLSTSGSEYPYKRGGKVLRRANQQDIIDQRHLSESARDEAAFCREQIRQLKLAMKLVSVEHLLGGERIVFYFAAETRVDFRELVRRLASQYRTRIEMRQVGARDEARLVADYERCGRRCCCQQFLKNLQPVAMKMAKLQKATLDPSKISGRCGRLMCCLRFEDAGYEELRKRLPRKNTWVRTEQVVGRVVDTHILTQLVALQLPDGTRVAVANEDIEERNIEPPKPGEAPPPPRRKAKEPRPEPATAGKTDGEPQKQRSGGKESAGGDGGSDGDKKQGSKRGKSRRGRRRRGGKKRSGKGKSGSKGKSGGKDQQASRGSRRSRRSRGRGKGKGKGQGGGKDGSKGSKS
jgi:cell fate regulator YaaT (PSP1 superfamily)